MTRPIPYAIAALCLVASSAAHAQSADEKRFCSKTAPNVIVYLDVTTPYDEADKSALIDGVSAIFEELQGGTRLSMRTIEDVSTSSRRLITTCIPFCNSEGFFADLLSDCTEGVVINQRKRQRQQISATLIEQTQARDELAHSAIIRTIANTAGEEFIEGRDNAIYIFSDMIENSDYLPGAEFFRDDNGALIERLSKDRLIPNLMGATVKVFGVGRGGSAARAALEQGRLNKVQDFWRLFFAATGATVALQQNLM